MADIPSNRTVLALMAHPDDAEILCGGTLIRLAALGWQVHIATMTAGDCGTTAETPWRISATRTEEAKRAATLIGGTYHCLDERDIYVVHDKPTVRKVVELMRRVGPSVVFTHPMRDYMMDHEAVHTLARAASFAFAAPNVSTLPMPEHAAIPHLYYCDPIEGIDPITGRTVQPTVAVDISDVIDRKTEMLATHASQREWLRAHHGMDEYLDAMQRHGQMRGQAIGAAYAEAFVQHRGHAYPRHDLLVELLGGAPLGDD